VKWHWPLIVMTMLSFLLFNAGHALGTQEIVNPVNTASKTKSGYGNILIVWTPSTTDIAVKVNVTMGTALIGAMRFTPDTLQQSLNYSNPPQSATGSFIIEFDATGQGGKLYVENLKWITKSNQGNVTGLVGLWSTGQ